MSLLSPSIRAIADRGFPEDRISKLREMFNKAGEGKTKLSVNDFSELKGLRKEPLLMACSVVKGAALALAEVPEANSAWLGEVIRQ